MKDLGIYKDSVIGADYKLQILDSAKELSDSLKKTYKSMKIDFSSFNTSNDGSDVAENPPAEIYEYQNFFLLEREDGKTVLLDGFRRLLWYSSPNSPILVRTYKQKDLSSSQILSLLVNLNHFKFYSKSSYQERGFSLLLKTVFDVDITKFREAFNAYLSSDKTKNTYSNYDNKTGTQKLESVKDRILNEHFVKDMKFLAKLKEEGCMVNSFFGALLYQKRVNKTTSFDTEKFLELFKTDKVLADLMVKYNKIGTNGSAKSQDVVNQIQQAYEKFFTLIDGETVEKTYAEKVQECKEIREQINKDKGWTKITGHKEVYKVERAMWERIKSNKEMKFKCIVLPEDREISGYSSFNHKSIPLDYGLNELVKLTKARKSTKWPYNDEMSYGLTDPKTTASWVVRHNYGGHNSYGKKYTKVDFVYDKELSEKYGAHFSTSYEIELWVDIPKDEWKDL
jgi:hypothetical protein